LTDFDSYGAAAPHRQTELSNGLGRFGFRRHESGDGRTAEAKRHERQWIGIRPTTNPLNVPARQTVGRFGLTGVDTAFAFTWPWASECQSLSPKFRRSRVVSNGAIATLPFN
jgi:hypothetical protein